MAGTAVNHRRCPVEATSPASRLLTAPLSAASARPRCPSQAPGFLLFANTRALAARLLQRVSNGTGGRWVFSATYRSSELLTSGKTSRVAPMCRLRFQAVARKLAQWTPAEDAARMSALGQ